MKLSRAALVVLASFSQIVAAAAQELGPVRESAEVSLVEVPVRVIDKNGQPIRGLTAADFTLYDEGKKQEVLAFDTIDLAEKAVAGNGAPLPPAARRRFLILFDFSFAQPKSVVAARKAAKEFVLNGMSDRDLAAVATYSVEKGLNLLVTFSNDRVQLSRAIETLGIDVPSGATDPLAFAFDARQLIAATEGRASARGTENSASAIIESLQTLASLQRARADEYSRGRVRQLVSSFSDLARALDAVEGRKDVIYLSEGFQSRLLVGVKDTDQEKEWILSGEMWKVDSDKRFGNTPLRNEVGEMSALFRRSDCVIHAVDIAGIRVEAERDAESVIVGPRETQDSLYQMAEGTGGEVFRNANDLQPLLDRVIRQTSLVYVLAFRPPTWNHEGKFHELKVKVARSGAHVSARSGYYERREFRHLSPLERSLSAADVIANEIAVQDVPARVLATPFATADAAALVPVLVEIPGDRFLAGEKAEKTALEIYVYANDQDNTLRDFFVQAVALDLSRNRDKILAGGLKYYGELRLPAGRYRLRTLVRNADTGRMGLTVSSLNVPAFSADQPYLLPPMFLESSEDWVFVRGRERPAEAVENASSSSGYPFLALGQENFSPAALPRIPAGRVSRVCLVSYHFGSPRGDENLKVGSQILDPEGKPLSEATLAIVGRSRLEPDGRRMLLLSFTAPNGLAPGRYGLRIFLQDAASGQARQASAPFLVP